MEVLNSAPVESQFTPLSTHQSQTPSSFYSGPPVLYHHSPSTTILINSHDLESAPIFRKLVSPQQQSNGSAHHAATEDQTEDLGHEITIQGVDVWVTSEKFLLFSRAFTTGISIPYLSISLHAIQPSPTTPSLLLQLLTSSGPQFDDHDPEGTISITIVPQNSNANGHNNESPAPTPVTTFPILSEAEPHLNAVEKLFSALSACADLHPDHDANSDFDIDDDDDDNAPHEDSGALYTQIEGLPPPMPGSGGWITAENVGDFFDEEGNFRAGESLGEGAGRVRGREDDEDNDRGVEGANGNGENHETEETKWRRTG
ncbi:MAG: hypothetical protein LQ339_008989 [Xanthoria mediterranea]|nr:MAG: hypothetical protein LQ339_008989 [Xanthoria mediterranea]